MDAYLICPETKQLIWLGRPVESENGAVHYYSQSPNSYNHEDMLLNKVLWRFLAEHARKELRIVYSGEFNDDEYQHISTWDVEAEEYVRGWPT